MKPTIRKKDGQLGDQTWNQRNDQVDAQKNVKQCVSRNADGDTMGGKPAVKKPVSMHNRVIQKCIRHASESVD
ncbi:hypothetical protein ACU8WE_10590 [Pseudomonas parakoreensis]